MVLGGRDRSEIERKTISLKLSCALHTTYLTRAYNKLGSWLKLASLNII